jgi:hypothetical protein
VQLVQGEDCLIQCVPLFCLDFTFAQRLLQHQQALASLRPHGRCEVGHRQEGDVAHQQLSLVDAELGGRQTEEPRCQRGTQDRCEQMRRLLVA